MDYKNTEFSLVIRVTFYFSLDLLCLSWLLTLV